MTAVWIDFKELRGKLDFAKVLQHYGVELRLRRQGRQHQGFCPLPMHKGQRRSPSFSADLQRGIWKCFGSCQEGGDILRFVALMEGLDPDRGEDIREVALKLMDTFGIECNSPPERVNGKRRQSKHRESRDEPQEKVEAEKNAGQAPTCPTLVNAPLDFALQGLDPSHPYLKERGLTPETIAYFGLGYCSRGLMQGRIAIPLHNEKGELVGYAGRLVDDSKIDADHPKYLLPSAREREGKRYEFRKSLLLYNYFQISGRQSDLIVVEGFPSVWHLWQHGYANVVALMGSDCTPEQANLIAKNIVPGGLATIFTDGDHAGDQCAIGIFRKVALRRRIRWVKLQKGKQPTDYPGEELQVMLSV